jgi:hypothetical protein
MKKVTALTVFSLLMFSLPLLLGGCMPSGMIDMGHDKYAVEYTSLISHDNARAWAFQRAEQECKSRDRVLYPLNEPPSLVRSSATVSLTFKCLEQNDPQLQAFRNYLR